mmetsp:Transcript_75272/g.196231  ORF Transcript_75272/g.196231 Transcript_75272/m.196231 type:complete len:330 (+) Transcript_75272:44-1033(+)
MFHGSTTRCSPGMNIIRLAVAFFQFACSCALKGNTAGHSDIDRPTLLFVAGLEGTGHHFFNSVFFNSHLNFAVFVNVLKGSWSQNGMMFSDKSWSRDDMDVNVEYLKGLAREHPGKLLHLHYTGSSSYPNGQGTHDQRLHHRQPNMVLLKEACDRAGVDLKVIVTQRSDADTLVATCMHRTDLESCENQSITLGTNIEVMTSQISQLVAHASERGSASASVTCAHYGNLLELGEALASMVADSSDQATSHDAIREAWEGSEYHHDPKSEIPSIIQQAGNIHGHRLDELCHSIEAADVPALLRHMLPAAVQQRPSFKQFIVDEQWRKKRV